MNSNATAQLDGLSRLPPAPGSAAPQATRLTDRLAEVERIILDSKQANEFEREIVWRLFGVISYWARPDNEHDRKAAKSKWLMAEIESIISDRAKRQNDPSSATRPTRAFACNRSAMAGFAAAHG